MYVFLIVCVCLLCMIQKTNQAPWGPMCTVSSQRVISVAMLHDTLIVTYLTANGLSAGGSGYFACTLGARGSTVVKVLCYKSEGRWFHPS